MTNETTIPQYGVLESEDNGLSTWRESESESWSERSFCNWVVRVRCVWVAQLAATSISNKQS